MHSARASLIARYVSVIAMATAFTATLVAQAPPEPRFDEQTTTITVSPGVTLGCSVVVPEGEGPFPGAVLLSVAGPNDRDQSVGPHRGFRDLAHGLAERGVASLRCDDRGVGDSSGRLFEATYDDLASEAVRRLDALSRVSGVDGARLGFVGNSEGGAVGPLAASLDERAAFVVLLAGPGLPGSETLSRQLDSAIVALAIDEQRAASLRSQYAEFLSIQRRDPSDPETRAAMTAFLEGGGRTLFPPYGFVPADVEGLAEYLSSPWHRSMISHDPIPVLHDLDLPVLALAGDKDLGLDPGLHLTAIRAALADNPSATVELLPGLNHLFQTAITGSPLEYPTLPESISADVVSRVGEWIVSVTR